MTQADPEPFNPTKHLTRVNGSEYLEVKWRLVWLRDQHPDANVETELVSLVDDTAVFRAKVMIPNGGLATGWGSETARDFRDFLEKAETKAIGRALAALGFGTQFCLDHIGGDTVGADHEELDPAPEGQILYLQSVAAKAGISDEALDQRALNLFGSPAHGLSRRDASHLAQIIRGETPVTETKRRRPPRRLAPVPSAPGLQAPSR